MSQEEEQRRKSAPREDVNSTKLTTATTGCVVVPVTLYYVGAFLFAVWSWLALFGRVRTGAAEFGLVVWMAVIVGLFHLAGVFVKPWLIGAVERVLGWLGTLARSKRTARGEWLVECDDEAVRCRGPEEEVESVRWADLQAVWIVTTDRGPWEDDLFYVLEGIEGECTVSSEALGVPGLIERLTQLPGLDEEAYTQAIRCTDNERFLVWRRHDGGSAPGDEGEPAEEERGDASAGP